MSPTRRELDIYRNENVGDLSDIMGNLKDITALLQKSYEDLSEGVVVPSARSGPELFSRRLHNLEEFVETVASGPRNNLLL